MPSDPRVVRALEALTQPIEQYRSAVAATLEEVRGHLTAGRSDAEARAERLQDQLGRFASGRIDAARLSLVLGAAPALEADALQRLQHASDVLRQVVAQGLELFHITVASGENLYVAVEARLAAIGRAFAAARVASAARVGAACDFDEAAALDSFPAAQWSAAERKLAPPLVVSVGGCDLHAATLAPFLDGGLKLLLLVDAPAAPAPLVRLITPSVLVIQAHRFEDVALLSTWPTTGVAAVMPQTAVSFVHNPAAGSESWQRLTVQGVGDTPVARVGGWTAAQQLDELRQLQALAAPPPAVPVAVAAKEAPPAAVDPADRLAAWLLQQANLGAASPSE